MTPPPQRSDLIAELAHLLIQGSFRPEQAESIDTWSQRVANSLTYEDTEIRLTNEDVKQAALIGHLTLKKLLTGGVTYHDPRTNVTLEL